MNVISPFAGTAARVKHDLTALPADQSGLVARDIDSIEWSELVAYQKTRAKAHAAGLLSAIDAEWLSAVLGGEDPTIEKWRQQPLEKRLLTLQILLDVMQRLPPCAARDVAPGRSWAFRSHRALAALPQGRGAAHPQSPPRPSCVTVLIASNVSPPPTAHERSPPSRSRGDHSCQPRSAR